MTKIEKLTTPEDIKIKKPIMSSEERFLWWKKNYFLTFGILISVLVLPIFAFRRGNIIGGIRISIILYGFVLIFLEMVRYKTKKADERFLESKGINIEIKKRWWNIPLKILFMLLRIYVIYLMIMTWRMTVSG